MNSHLLSVQGPSQSIDLPVLLSVCFCRDILRYYPRSFSMCECTKSSRHLTSFYFFYFIVLFFSWLSLLTHLVCQRASAAPEARAAYGRMACMAAQFGEPLLLSHVREPSQGPTTTRLPSQPPTPKPQQQEDTGGAPFFSSKRRRRRCEYSVPSDVFTLTALLDVLGRAHNATGAFWVFRRVRHPTAHGALRLQPNVGTSRACLLPCLFVCLFLCSLSLSLSLRYVFRQQPFVAYY